MERLQNMRNNAAGDGENNCILCGEAFSFFTRQNQSKQSSFVLAILAKKTYQNIKDIFMNFNAFFYHKIY